jgi:uncharacterized membrane protein YeaQ/YmgE (transglycosylase-associated protein family)
MTNLLLWILIGLVAGWLAGMIMKTRKRSVAANLLLGMLGAVIGGFLLGLLGLSGHGLVGSLVTATAGAVALLWVVDYFQRH